MVRYRVHYEGRVQGVGFRMTARSIAREHSGVTGWVRNEPDRSVLLEAQGDRSRLFAFLDDIRTRMDAFIEVEERTPMECAPHERRFVIEH